MTFSYGVVSDSPSVKTERPELARSDRGQDRADKPLTPESRHVHGSDCGHRQDGAVDSGHKHDDGCGHGALGTLEVGTSQRAEARQALDSFGTRRNSRLSAVGGDKRDPVKVPETNRTESVKVSPKAHDIGAPTQYSAERSPAKNGQALGVDDRLGGPSGPSKTGALIGALSADRKITVDPTLQREVRDQSGLSTTQSTRTNGGTMAREGETARFKPDSSPRVVASNVLKTDHQIGSAVVRQQAPEREGGSSPKSNQKFAEREAVAQVQPPRKSTVSLAQMREGWALIRPYVERQAGSSRDVKPAATVVRSETTMNEPSTAKGETVRESEIAKVLIRQNSQSAEFSGRSSGPLRERETSASNSATTHQPKPSITTQSRDPERSLARAHNSSSPKSSTGPANRSSALPRVSSPARSSRLEGAPSRTELSARATSLKARLLSTTSTRQTRRTLNRSLETKHFESPVRSEGRPRVSPRVNSIPSKSVANPVARKRDQSQVRIDAQNQRGDRVGGRLSEHRKIESERGGSRPRSPDDVTRRTSGLEIKGQPHTQVLGRDFRSRPVKAAFSASERKAAQDKDRLTKKPEVSKKAMQRVAKGLESVARQQAKHASLRARGATSEISAAFSRTLQEAFVDLMDEARRRLEEELRFELQHRSGNSRARVKRKMRSASEFLRKKLERDERRQKERANQGMAGSGVESVAAVGTGTGSPHGAQQLLRSGQKGMSKSLDTFTAESDDESGEESFDGNY